MVANRVFEIMRHIVGDESVMLNEPMKNHTSFKVGGPADVLVLPSSTEQLVEIIKVCREGDIPFYIIGNGTNLIVRDQGIRGVVIKTYENYNKCFVDGDTIEAFSGTLLSKIASIALKNGLAGMEFASGIPGTLGGAVCMNAGAYGGEMKDVIVETQYMDPNNNVVTILQEQHEFGYRSSRIQREKGIVLKSKMKLKKGNKDEIRALMNHLNERRRDKQPLNLPSAGSTFRRPEGYYSGKLIQDCGLTGYSVGGAKVSEKHCGFIVNSGNAKADDIIKLIEHIQNAVKTKFGVDLLTEVKIIGEN